jgi:hypothetical protein
MTVSGVWRFIDFNNYTEWPKFFTKDSDFPARGLGII